MSVYIGEFWNKIHFSVLSTSWVFVMSVVIERPLERKSSYDIMTEFFGGAQLLSELSNAYWQAGVREVCGRVPLTEPVLDFQIDRAMRAGLIPETKTSVEPVAGFPFAKLWKFEHANKTRGTPTILIGHPYTASDPRVLSDMVLMGLRYGNVLVVGQRDSHYVRREHRNGLNKSTGAYIEVMKQNPKCHVLVISESGISGVIATSMMSQDPALEKFAPASLTVVCSPLDARKNPGPMNRLVTSTSENPTFMPVAVYYPGFARDILPGEIAKALFNEKPPETWVKAEPIAVPREHVEDMLRDVFREFKLARGVYEFNGTPVETDKIDCRVNTISGTEDEICPGEQVHALKDMVSPRAEVNRLVIEGAGHYDLLTGPVLEKYIGPMMEDTLGLRPVALGSAQARAQATASLRIA